MRTLLALVFAFCSASLAGAADVGFDIGHTGWSTLLARHVHWNEAKTASSVDYAGFSNDRPALQDYLDALARVDEVTFASWPPADREAFLINAYNAATIALVLTRYPDLDSIKDLGGLFSSPWIKVFVNLLGQRRSLDAIEHDLLRGAADYADPRIHFAVNCASVGCPALRPEAYVGTSLREQLEDQARRFLSDRSRNRFDTDRGRLLISRIFDWYAQDFDAHAGGVRAFLADRAAVLGLDAGRAVQLRNGEMPIVFGEYDWSLNRAVPESRP
ncbi:MAG: DUF547 domain-containing protein [Dokdonella sp.]|nr:DUF547 domain-containing protein [Dokdonella sp.]MCB1570615.1 DUF547 domain-containing protein [Xanthomonadales bacterium]MCB1576379.1 DUF547 domain-containing protein [Xanthomonadales bacterium]